MEYVTKEEKRTFRTWAEISESAVRHNFEVTKRSAGDCKVMCVIKGDAHGHDASILGPILQECGADAFAVAAFSEAIALREAGVVRPILILGWTAPEFAQTLADRKLTQSVFSAAYAEELASAAEEKGLVLDVHLKVDTGMSRTGFFAQTDPAAAAEEMLAVMNRSSLHVTGIFTHYAAADMPELDDYTAWQLQNLIDTVNALKEKGANLSEVMIHSSNSAGTLYHPEAHLDMVRAGVMLYGFSPRGIPGEPDSLEQILTLKTRVVMVKEIPAGTKVSYGCTYTAEKPIRIATVCAGYADAYPRKLSNSGAYAVIRGEKCPQIGRVCMDMCMFDVTGTDVQAGDEVILYGNGGLTLDEIGEIVGTINCETTCLLTERVKRVLVP